MTFAEIIKEYIHSHSVKFYLLIFICSLVYITKVLLTSVTYSKFFEKDPDFNEIIKRVCLLWTTMCVLYIVKARMEADFIPEFLSYIRKRLIEKYIKSNEVNLNEKDINADLNRILEVTRNIKDIFTWYATTFIPIIVLIIIIICYFLVRYPRIAVVNIISNIINGYIIINKTSSLIEKSNERENQFVKMVGKVDENFNNLMNIFLNDKIDDTLKVNDTIEKEYIDTFKKQCSELETINTMLKVNNYIFAFISLYILHKTSSIENFINVLLIYTFYISAFENMSEDIPYFITVIGNIKNVEKELDNKIEPNKTIPDSYPLSLDNFKGQISFKDISFFYEPEKHIFEHLNLDINAGERVSIISGSGRGKTTLMKLLLKFYEPQNGDILLDGKSIKELDPKDIRRNINYLNQKTVLIQDTILNNMRYGNNKTDDEIVSLLTKYDLVRVFNCKSAPTVECLQKNVDKNGTNISLGMQKIIFIVRAILKDNIPVYIFDEPLSGVDPTTRKRVIKLIDDKTKGKTVLIITHDAEINQIVNRSIDLDHI